MTQILANSAIVSFVLQWGRSIMPNAAEYRSGPVRDDAVLIFCLFIPEKKYQRRGLGSSANPSGPVEF